MAPEALDTAPVMEVRRPGGETSSSGRGILERVVALSGLVPLAAPKRRCIARGRLAAGGTPLASSLRFPDPGLLGVCWWEGDFATGMRSIRGLDPVAVSGSLNPFALRLSRGPLSDAAG